MLENKSNGDTIHVYGSAECISSFLQKEYELGSELIAGSITQLLVLLNNEENGEFDFDGVSQDEYSQELTTGLLGTLPVYINTTGVVIQALKSLPESLLSSLAQQLMTRDLSMRTLARDVFKNSLVALATAFAENIIELKGSTLCVCYRAWKLTKGRHPFSLEDIALDAEIVGSGAGQERRFICALSTDDNIQQTPQATFRCRAHTDENYCHYTPDDFEKILEKLCSIRVLELNTGGGKDCYVFRR